MKPRHPNQFAILTAVTLFAFAVSSGPALSVDDGGRFPPPPPQDQGRKGQKPQQQKSQKKKKEQKSEQELRDGYQHAYRLIMSGQYEAGIAAMHDLGHDDNPEVANYLGYASRKLGRYEDSKIWYERALAADPNHVRTWSYYGMWHAEQGNMLKARDHLDRIQAICGNTTCREYVDLKGVMEGTATY
jgi:tetratricopeptide (TPR) repeat protein